jgi:hypothetical protein
MRSSESLRGPAVERNSPFFKLEISSLLGLFLAVLLAGAAPALDLGRAGDLALGVATDFGLDFAGLTSGLSGFTWEAALAGRRSE